MKSLLSNILLPAVSAALFVSCEKNITLEMPEPEEKIAVEGYLEKGAPPFVILTRNKPYFGSLSLSEAESLFVRNAVVTVSDGVSSVQLNELSYFDSAANLNFYFYTDNTFPLFTGQVGKNYQITVEAEGKSVYAYTSIPNLLPLDSIWTAPHPNPENDSMVVLMCHYTDPDTTGNYIRYYTSRNGDPFLPGYYSAFDDRLINGQSFDFPLDRGYDKTSGSFNIDTYRFFWKGDTIVVRWAAIDKATFDFWYTWEFSVNSFDNPFSAPVMVLSNVVGGLGVWGGYASSYDTLIVPKN